MKLEIHLLRSHLNSVDQISPIGKKMLMSLGIPRAANLDGLLCLRPHVYQDHYQTSAASNISMKKKTRQITEFKSLPENFPFASLASVHSFGFRDARTRRSSNLHNKSDRFAIICSARSGFDAQTQWICDFVILFYADNTAEVLYGVRVHSMQMQGKAFEPG